MEGPRGAGSEIGAPFSAGSSGAQVLRHRSSWTASPSLPRCPLAYTAGGFAFPDASSDAALLAPINLAPACSWPAPQAGGVPAAAGALRAVAVLPTDSTAVLPTDSTAVLPTDSTADPALRETCTKEQWRPYRAPGNRL
ncbi:hypothetical protein PAL_GLEAN10004355 [Pteropus alecto]|uniref:Uncharacterized protein n=1 Tax=Pteropus alecto TaxID=9402 RepID=L5L785_PTEAL|nr:hypothetical protein PAL_GLEAN10004355 [Pteropus alecto]